MEAAAARIGSELVGQAAATAAAIGTGAAAGLLLSGAASGAILAPAAAVTAVAFAASLGRGPREMRDPALRLACDAVSAAAAAALFWAAPGLTPF